MSLVRCAVPLHSITRECRRMSSRSTLTSISDEYTEVAEYPPIVEKKKFTKKPEVIPLELTVEERQIKQNINHYYGRRVISFNNEYIPYNSLGFIQHCTNTNFIPGGLPLHYRSINVDKFVDKITPLIQEAILLENDIIKNRNLSAEESENFLLDSIIKQINRIVLKNSESTDNLSDVQVDVEPRHNYFWVVDGIEPPEICRKVRRGVEWMKHLSDESIPRGAQYMGHPRLAVRCKRPLMPISADIPDKIETNLISDPRVYGFRQTHQHVMTTPGCWAGDKHRFGLISYEKTAKRDYQLEDEASHVHAILSSYAWLSSQAFYLQNPTEHTLLTQLVMTDGKNFSFYIYQLDKNGNTCWGGETRPLYTEAKGGQLINFNQDVLKDLAKLYLNASNAHSEDAFLEAQTVSSIEHPERCQWIYNQHRHLMSGRPRHKLPPETYHWEKIYKIDHKTRPLEPRRRPFELGINPWKRKLDDWPNVYIPKVLREDKKDKFRPKYYPK